MSHLSVPVSVGELLDKMTILEIKSKRLRDPQQRANVERELSLLRDTWNNSELSSCDVGSLVDELTVINEKLWVIEDQLREKERDGLFDDQFVELARSVYRVNDRRAAIKHQINQLSGSELIEEKQHPIY